MFVLKVKCSLRVANRANAKDAKDAKEKMDLTEGGVDVVGRLPSLSSR